MTDQPLACSFSLSGFSLSDDECALFRQARPFGYILFKRNIDNPSQLRALTDSLRDLHGDEDLPILIDQEGGRVRRMGPPHWPAWPAAQACNNAEEAGCIASDMARSLADVGINVNCAPVLDVLCENTHEAIGDRAFSDNPDDVFVKALEQCISFLDRGITPVIKHIPGQGRATSDSHYDLPVVKASLEELQAIDFKPFKRLSAEEIVPQIWGMVSHVIYEAVDAEHPASASEKVVNLIRGAQIGFDGLLLSDDVSMGALKKYGNPADRCVKMLESGCDIALYCAGNLEDMEKIAAAVPVMSAAAKDRYERSRVTKQRRISGRPAA